MKISKSAFQLAAVVAVLILSVGCTSEEHKETAHLQGKVTLAGQPVADGNGIQAAITFSPVDASQSNPAGVAIVDGKYDVPNAPKGKVKVTFLILKEGPAKPFEPGARAMPTMTSLVPAEKDKGIAIDVDADKSDLNFDL